MQEALLLSAMVAPPVIWSGVKLWGVFSNILDEVDKARHLSRMRRLSEDREKAEIERLRSESKVYVIKRKNGDPVILSPTALKRKAGQRLPSPAAEMPIGGSVDTGDTDTVKTAGRWVWIYDRNGRKVSHRTSSLSQAQADKIWELYREAGGDLGSKADLSGRDGGQTVSGIAKAVFGAKGGRQNAHVKWILGLSDECPDSAYYKVKKP